MTTDKDMQIESSYQGHSPQYTHVLPRGTVTNGLGTSLSTSSNSKHIKGAYVRVALVRNVLLLRSQVIRRDEGNMFEKFTCHWFVEYLVC
jgi:hypothetical protein